MLSLICNYVYDKLFPKPVVGQKRKYQEYTDYPPMKQMKFENNSAFNVEYSGELSNNMQRKENFMRDEQECRITREMLSKKWVPSSLMARQSIHKNKNSSNPVDSDSKKKIQSSDNNKIKQPLFENSNNMPQSEENKFCSKHRHLLTAGKDAKCKPTSGKLLSSYKLSHTKQNGEKFNSSFQSNVKKSLSLVNQSYRLSEKMQYMQLLQQHTARFNSYLAPFSFKKQVNSQQNKKSTIPLIDLTKEKNSVLVNRSRESVAWTSSLSKSDDLLSLETGSSESYKEQGGSNSLQSMLKTHAVTGASLIDEILSRHATESAVKRRQAEIEEAKLKVLTESNSKSYSAALEERLRRYMRITTPVLEEIQPSKEEYVLPQLSKEQEAKISSILVPSPAGEVLVEKFGLQIKRRDLQTLKGLNWLNDEIINFYMNLIMERGKTDNLPSVYAFNTFFYPKLISSGHSSLKRWTKKVDIFSHDLILVPIHLGMHWCMALIDFRSKEVKYYDSMGSPNNRCLSALLQYLEAESLDKKKVEYSTKDWQEINVENIPQQMNGSDCGVFSCAFAEHLARDSPLLFTQENMPYFRKKMALEIVESKLLT